MSGYLPIEDPALVFALVAALILLSPFLLGRFRLPGMVGLLLAGAVLGPNALGVLARDRSFVLFGTVGLLYIMFLAALEIDLGLFRRTKLHSIVFGLSTFALPQGLGTLVAYYLLDFGLLASVLIASLFASHTLLAFPVASRLGIATSRAATTAVGGTILTDTLALLVLAVVAASVRGEVDAEFWYRLGSSVFAYVTAILVGLPHLARWLLRRIAQDGVSEFVFVLVVVFGSASLSRLVGIEPIVGAFLAGLALNRLIPRTSTLMSRLRFTGEAIFIPFFLLSVGMLFDIRVFHGSIRAWSVAMAMLLSVVGMKWLAAEAMRAVLGYSRDEARVIFGLSVAQAAATLAATLVGYELGLLDDTVVNGAILMILVTCLAAPLIVFRYGRSLSRERSSEDPSIDRPQRVLVALSHPAGVDRLLELALLIHEKNQGQQVYPLSVIEESGGAADDVARAERMLSKAVLHLSAADVPASPVTRIDLSVPAGILRARRELRATEIVMGWAGRSTTTGFFFGSMLEKLLADAECSLIVGRLQQPVSASRRLLLLVPPNADQEPSFATTARLVARIARVLPVELVILGPEPAAEHARQRLIAASASLSPLLLRLSSWASLLQVLAEVAREGDLIVLGGVRSSTAMWRTPVGVLPGRIARRLPQQSLVLIYPAAPLHSHAPGTTLVPPGDETRLVTEHIVIGVHAATLDEAVGALITALPDIPPDEDTQPLADKLLASTEELAPNVVLMHTETELAQRSAVALGTSRRGIRHPRSARRAHVLVLLVEPPRQDAAGHLRNLAVVARAFYSPDVIERAKRATNAEELRELLRGR